MIQQLSAVPYLPKRLRKTISKLKPLKGGEWDSQKKVIKEIKSLLTNQLLKIQDNKCAYCGLPLGETSRLEIEHIAPKGGVKRPQHPEFSFTPLNLVLACNKCNCSGGKGTFDTIEGRKDINYRLNQFNIVHPYFDDHSLHYDWETNDQNDILIIAKTDKGQQSIDLLDLASPKRTEARVRFQLSEYIKTLPNGDALLAASAHSVTNAI